VVRTILAEPGIDVVLLLITMAAEPRASFYGTEIPKLAAATQKPIVVAWVGALSVAQMGYPMLAKAEVPHFQSVRQAVRAIRAACDYRAFLARRGFLS
jgi:acyl-CoA synthetase (NDP forming)